MLKAEQPEVIEMDAEDVQCAIEDLLEAIDIWGAEEVQLAWAIINDEAEAVQTRH